MSLVAQQRQQQQQTLLRSIHVVAVVLVLRLVVAPAETGAGTVVVFVTTVIAELVGALSVAMLGREMWRMTRKKKKKKKGQWKTTMKARKRDSLPCEEAECNAVALLNREETSTAHTKKGERISPV